MAINCNIWKLGNWFRRSHGLDSAEGTPFSCLTNDEQSKLRKIARWYYQDTIFDVGLSRSASRAVRGEISPSQLKGGNIRLYAMSRWYDQYVVPIRNRFRNSLSDYQSNILNEAWKSYKSGNSNYISNEKRKRGPNAGSTFNGSSQQKGIFYWIGKDPTRVFGTGGSV